MKIGRVIGLINPVSLSRKKNFHNLLFNFGNQLYVYGSNLYLYDYGGYSNILDNTNNTNTCLSIEEIEAFSVVNK